MNDLSLLHKKTLRGKWTVGSLLPIIYEATKPKGGKGHILRLLMDLEPAFLIKKSRSCPPKESKDPGFGGPSAEHHYRCDVVVSVCLAYNR